MAGAGTIGLPFVRTFRPSPAHAAGAFTYNPAARFDLAVSEVKLRRSSAGRMLMARIYQPKGPGPFPTVLDLHGGAWNRKDRFAEEPMDRALAASGLLVVAVDMTLAPEAPYPACVQDANYAVRPRKDAARQMEHLRMSQISHFGVRHRPIWFPALSVGSIPIAVGSTPRSESNSQPRLKRSCSVIKNVMLLLMRLQYRRASLA
jgi:poly(3-hydroxybutyrate) depolymerase